MRLLKLKRNGIENNLLSIIKIVLQSTNYQYNLIMTNNINISLERCVSLSNASKNSLHNKGVQKGSNVYKDAGLPAPELSVRGFVQVALDVPATVVGAIFCAREILLRQEQQGVLTVRPCVQRVFGVDETGKKKP